MTLLLCIAAFIVIFSMGWTARGWMETERQRVRRIPEHPVMHPQPFRVIEGGLQRPNRLIDWQREDWGG